MFVENPRWWDEFRQYTRHNLTEPLLLAIALDAERRVHKVSRKLARSIDYDVASDFHGFVGSNLEYAASEEKGSRPHVIRAHGNGVLRFVINGQEVFVKSVNHPGTKAHPYLRPALYRRRSLANLRRLL